MRWLSAFALFATLLSAAPPAKKPTQKRPGTRRKVTRVRKPAYQVHPDPERYKEIQQALADKGYAVTVFDRHRYAAMETSFANGGQLSASNAEVWNHWSTIWKGFAWMLRSDAPLLVNPLPSWHKFSWFAEFVGNIRNYRANTIATTRLAIAARKHLFEIAEREAKQRPPSS